MPTVLDVADYILKNHGTRMELSKLNALTYVCQGWSLATRHLPLFFENFIAGATGPYFPMFHTSDGADPFVRDLWAGGDSSRLSEEDTAIIDVVTDIFGDIDGKSLVQELMRANTPWDLTRRYEGGTFIATDRLEAYYTDKINIISGVYAH